MNPTFLEAPQLNESEAPTPDSTEAPSSGWSKDFVEHIRTVHFSLVAVCLRTAGFTVQRLSEWFVDEHGAPRRNVSDPEVIRFCSKNGWLLVTRDHEMKHMHTEEIKRTEIAVLATAHNSCEDQDEWVAALINLKSRILREFKKRQRPWFGVFSRGCTLTIKTLT